jgi:hypothetical protein
MKRQHAPSPRMTDRTARVLAAAVAVTVALVSHIGPASADETNPVGQVARQAALQLQAALHGAGLHHPRALAQAPASGTGGTSTVPATTPQGLPTGFGYTLDVSMAKPYGNIGSATRWLPGGVDAVAGYGFDPSLRASLSYYELQHYPQGFNSGSVPLYIQGLAPPVGTVDLSTTHIDLTTKDRFFFVTLSKLFRVGPLPIVISPVYSARWATIGGNGNDVVPFEYKGLPVTGVHVRTAQYDTVAFTFPFLSTPRMFGTFTAAPTWLTHLNGVNQENHMQWYQVLYLEYKVDDMTKLFFQPQSSRDYLPPDPYAQHVFAYFLGVSRKITGWSFVQLTLNSGGPTNYAPYGAVALTCQGLPCSQHPAVLSIGGLKATQVQLQIGVGTPSVLPF